LEPYLSKTIIIGNMISMFGLTSNKPVLSTFRTG